MITTFIRSQGNAFSKSPGHARNPGRSPTGFGVIALAAQSLGFPTYLDASGTIDPNQWYSEADVTERRYIGATTLTNRFRLKFPAYYSLRDSSSDDLINGAHEIIVNGFPFPTTVNFNAPTSTTFAGPTMRNEWNAGGGIFYSSETTATGAVRTWDQMIEDIEDAFPDLITFPTSGSSGYWLDASGIAGTTTVGGSIAQWGFELVADSNHDYKTFPIEPWGKTAVVLHPFAQKSKRRYRRTTPSVLHPTRLTAINNVTVHPITILDTVALPGGIDVCEPDALNASLLAALPACVPGRRVLSVGQKFVVPPDSAPLP